ncbi:PAAR domain-containing protein [Burkholderia plantarii]|uniref:PAAR domain-containing protein n=1 Tax=Burkholderia plantarii TaxID=41899 RepID=UPI00272D21E3|nr:PAAR domain-containing protein [Burkholderia plantarii]WLE59262.1 PAAR domain-containing protein [Burkholderia plantarii]
MRRAYLLVGDKSSVGGVITEGIDGTDHTGRAIAFIGAAVACPACSSTGHITAAGQRWPMSMFGRDIALDGDVCVCKCAPPPRMIADASTTMAQVVESSGAAASAFAAAAAGAAPTPAPVAVASATTPSATGASALAAEPFSLTGASAAGGTFQTAGRVSEEREQECMDRYEMDMELCNAGRAMYKSPAYYTECSRRAFDRYQTCRGY